METQWIRRWNSWIAAKPVKPGVFRRKEGGFLVRGRVTDPRTGRLKEVKLTLDDVEAVEASRRLREALAEVRNGSRRAAHKRVRFSEYAASLFEHKVKTGKIKSAKTREKWEYVIRLHLDPVFGDVFVDAITKADIKAWLNTMGEAIEDQTLNPTTANDRLALFKTIIGAAAAEYEWERDPLKGIEPFDTSEHPTYTEEEPNSLTVGEVPRFLAKMREVYPQFFAITALGFATGLRPSSLRPLRRQGDEPDVLWDESILLVRRSQTIGDEVMNTTKTKKRQRIFLPGDLMNVLRWHTKHLRWRKARSSDLLFPSRLGTFLARSVLDRPFQDVAEKLGLQHNLTPRAMRRTYQDLARAAEVRDLVTRSISGHATEAMQEHYSTVQIEEMRASIDKIISIAKVREALAA